MAFIHIELKNDNIFEATHANVSAPSMTTDDADVEVTLNAKRQPISPN